MMFFFKRATVMKNFTYAVLALTMSASVGSFAASLTVPMQTVTEQNQQVSAGTITISESNYGLIFTPNLHGLAVGPHGFHIHTIPSCAMQGMAAGGHLDPAKSDKHLGPYNQAGHLGDLPVLYVNNDATVTTPVLAPRLTSLSQVKNHALMIHEGGDNYSDEPKKLGGGGGRMICGVISG
jgi:Cu-Zn family superoxide dismutase